MVLSSHLPWTLFLLLLASLVSVPHLPQCWCSMVELWLFPDVPFLSQYPLRVLDYITVSAGVPLPAGTSLFLILIAWKMSGILVRCIAQRPAPRIRLLFFSLLHWDYSWKESLREVKCHFHSVLQSVCCKPVPCSADFEHLLGFCTVNLFPHNFCSLTGRQEKGREGQRKGII